MGAIQVSAREGYSLWAETWDTTPSPIVALEERTLLPWIGRLHPRRAVDVGCGTGRWTTRLSAIGVDASLAMLAVAAAKSGLRGRLAVGAAAARQTAPEIGVSRVMRRGLIRRDENWARATGGVSAVGKPGTASQFQRRELVAVPALRSIHCRTRLSP
jgi:SAM-dependent methyltransferase